MVNSIEMKIAKIAAQRWEQAEPTTLEEAKKITDRSEISAAKGIVSVLGLNPELEARLLDDIYNKESISEELAKEIIDGFRNCVDVFERSETNIGASSIINILSVIHDEWAKRFPDKFLQEGRNKEYQFAPLMLLSWEEAKSDLVFLKPILESAGIYVDEKDIEQQFEVMQKEFLIDNNLTSHESIVTAIRDKKFYPALEGLETKNGGNIQELMMQSDIAEKMAKQIEMQVSVKSREDLAIDLIKIDNHRLDLLAGSYVGGMVSKREQLLFKCIGKPHTKEVIDSLTAISGHAMEIGEASRISKFESERKSENPDMDKPGRIQFEVNGVKRSIIVSKRELLNSGRNGIDPEKMGLETDRVYSKDEDKVREVLLSGETEIGYVQSKQTGIMKSNDIEMISRPMPKNIYDLGNTLSIGFPADITTVPGQYDSPEKIYTNDFISFEDCSEEQKAAIRRREKEIARFKEKVTSDIDGKYDKKGIISIPIYKTNTGRLGTDAPHAEVEGTIQLDVTQRELAEAGILPEDFGWKRVKDRGISAKDVAEADKKEGLTTAEPERVGKIIAKLLGKDIGKDTEDKGE